jgi:hypothetical protein
MSLVTWSLSSLSLLHYSPDKEEVLKRAAVYLDELCSLRLSLKSCKRLCSEKIGALANDMKIV